MINKKILITIEEQPDKIEASTIGRIIFYNYTEEAQPYPAADNDQHEYLKYS